jgi:archaellin
MSSDLTIGSEYSTFNDFVLAPPLNYSDWNGHQITWRDLPQVRSEVERRILQIYNAGNHVLAYQLAALYFEQIHPRYEIQLAKKSSKATPSDAGLSQERYYIEFYDQYIQETKKVLFEASIINDPPILEPISETNYPTLWAWQTYCLEKGISQSSKTDSGGFKEFWKEHKKAIIIAVVVIVVAVTVAVIIVTTAGSGTQVAVATGAAAVEEAISSYNSSDACDLKLQDLQHEFQVDEEIENFAKTIGASDIDHADGPITVIQTDSITEISPESLANLVTAWNTNFNPVIASTNELFFEEAILREEINRPPEQESIIDLARKIGAGLAHEAVNAAGQIGSVVPEFLEEIGDIGKRWGIDRFIDSRDLSSFTPQENFDSSLGFFHEKIDDLFNTNVASSYAPDAPQPEFIIGYIPFPGTGKIPVTQANNVWGWRLGDSIQNRTIFGTVPRWSTVRARYWKNEAFYRAEEYNAAQLERMKNGLAPQRVNKLTGEIETMELHHIPPQREGGLFDFVKVWPDEHADLDSFRRTKR